MSSTRKLDVYLRTHTGANMHSGNRFVPFGKESLIEGCLRSLVRSLLNVGSHLDIVVTLIDDHSTPSAVEKFCSILRGSGLPWRLVQLPQGVTGNSASLRAQYKEAIKTARDLIYFVEDDYLHCDTAILEMIGAHTLFSKHLQGKEVGIFPVDYPDSYGRLFSECRIVVGERRHFRTVTDSTGTLLIGKNLFLKNWDKFAALSLYGVIPEISETSTINKIWHSGEAFLFAPISTLAIHMQCKEQISPYVRWETWWERFAR